MIYLDVDDTLSAFREHCVARGVPRWDGSWYTTDPATWTDEQKFIQSETNRQMELPDFWLTMPLIDRAHELVSAAALRQDTFLLTALPRGIHESLHQRIAHDKIAWAVKHLHVPRERVLVCLRPEKVKYATWYSGNTDQYYPALLVDDATQNCEEWEVAGGRAHHFTDMAEAIQAVKEH